MRKAISIYRLIGPILLGSALMLVGCAPQSTALKDSEGPNLITILDEPSPPNFSVNPALIRISAGQEVVWSNRTAGVIELSLYPILDEAERGILRRMAAWAGLDQDEIGEPAPRQDDLEGLRDAIRQQRREIDLLRSELAAEGPSSAMASRLDALEERLRIQEDQLGRVLEQTDSPPPAPPPRMPGFIQPFSSVSGRFDAPGQYAYRLFQSSPYRRSGQIQGRITVVP